MNDCELLDTPDVELYFYGELDPVGLMRVDAHIRDCAACRQRLEDLHVIRRALAASRPLVDAPPAGDWSGFMRRLDGAVGRSAGRQTGARVILERTDRGWSARHLVALAAMLALVTIGVFMAARFRTAETRTVVSTQPEPARAQPVSPAPVTAAAETPEHAARGQRRASRTLQARGPRPGDARSRQTRSEDWEYERRLAGTLLTDTRLSRQAATERRLRRRPCHGRPRDRVSRSVRMSADRTAPRSRGIAADHGEIVVKMQVVAGSAESEEPMKMKWLAVGMTVWIATAGSGSRRRPRNRNGSRSRRTTSPTNSGCARSPSWIVADDTKAEPRRGVVLARAQ
jgi:hypothetical protein